MARPRGKNFSVVVKPTIDREKGFAIVHDYLTLVHPWLMGLKGEILAAIGTLEGEDELLGKETELMVNWNALESLIIEKRAEWIRLRKGELVCVVDNSWK